MSNVEVHTADSAAQALELLGQQNYDTLVSDIKMPGMDSFDVLAFVSREYPEVPVVLITGHGEHDLAIRALREGAYDYLLKPIDRDDFIAAVSRALLTPRLRREVSEQHKTLELCALGSTSLRAAEAPLLLRRSCLTISRTALKVCICRGSQLSITPVGSY